MTAISAGVDIGGTFTDIVLLVEGGENGERHFVWTKVPSTPAVPAEGVLSSLDAGLRRSDGAFADVVRFMHATTVGTNAVLEEKGARLGVLATDGFEDTLEIGRQKRTQMYDLFLEAETPIFLCPAERRLPVRERLAASGEILHPLEESDVVEHARTFEQLGVEAIAVIYLFAFRNGEHEQETARILAEQLPGVSISLSHQVSPVFREYERTCVTAFDAYLRPVMGEYLRDLTRRLRDAGVDGSIQTMKSRGGLASIEGAVDQPVTTMLSGPAAGVVGAKFVAQGSGFENVITLDMGGTSADVAVIREAKPLISTLGGIGSFPLNIPMVDVQTIGAGGGSIAWIDAAGGLRVGPASAGADPGPACYGRGGDRATVTDASLVLGYLDPEHPLGEGVSLSFSAAWDAVGVLADDLGMDTRAAALGIHRIVNARMADAIRLVSIKRGYDPRKFDLMPFGGGGPVHGGALSTELGIQRCVVPRSSGVLSALGLLVSNIEYDHAITYLKPVSDVDVADVNVLLSTLRDRCLNQMRQDGHDTSGCVVRYSADMRYIGQSSELEVELHVPVAEADVDVAAARFASEHDRVYGYAPEDADAEIVNLRAVALRLPEEDVTNALTKALAVKTDERLEPIGTRECWFLGHDRPFDTPVLDRQQADGVIEIAGPAIVQQEDTTVVVYPGFNCRSGALGNLILERA